MKLKRERKFRLEFWFWKYSTTNHVYKDVVFISSEKKAMNKALKELSKFIAKEQALREKPLYIVGTSVREFTIHGNDYSQLYIRR